MIREAPNATPFPYTTLFRSGGGSNFRVKILLSEVTNPTRIAPVEAPIFGYHGPRSRSEEHTSELQSRRDLVCRLLLAKKKRISQSAVTTSMPSLAGWAVPLS